MKPEEAIDIIKRMHKGAPTTDQYEALELAYEALETNSEGCFAKLLGNGRKIRMP